MTKLLSLSALATAVFLAGCSTVSLEEKGPGYTSLGANTVADRPAASPVDVGINWSWRIVGDQAVRPLQVFDMQGLTYLQMPEGSPEVVLMADGQIVPFQKSTPYLIVQGTPARMDVVRDGYRAVLVRDVPQIQAPPPAAAHPSAQGSRLRRSAISTPAPQPQTAPVQPPVAAPLATEAAPAAASPAAAPVQRRGRIKRVQMP